MIGKLSPKVRFQEAPLLGLGDSIPKLKNPKSHITWHSFLAWEDRTELRLYILFKFVPAFDCCGLS